MRDVVRQAFLPFTTPLEGSVPWMYPDVKNLVSTGIGNLIDPIGLAMSVPFVRADGAPATHAEIAEEWQRIKTLPPDAQGRAAPMLGHLYAKRFATLRLTPEGLESLVFGKLDEMDRYLSKRFPEYADWPADAQLGTLSMAWACGPAFRFPHLESALRARDFRTASVECFMPEERTISGLRPRNKANRILYTNAAISPDPETLFWPRDLKTEPGSPVTPVPDTVPAPDDQPIIHPLPGREDP